jgi:hypothetical protein
LENFLKERQKETKREIEKVEKKKKEEENIQKPLDEPNLIPKNETPFLDEADKKISALNLRQVETRSNIMAFIEKSIDKLNHKDGNNIIKEYVPKVKDTQMKM